MEEGGSTTNPEPRPSEGDIYLAAALLCDNVLIEKDDTISVIRIIDRWALIVVNPDAAATLPPGTIPLTGLVSLRSQTHGASGVVRIDQVDPDGRRSSWPDLPFVLEGEQPGANLILKMALDARGEGLYWFDVVVNERVLSRMPIRVVYQKQLPASPEADPTR